MRFRTEISPIDLAKTLGCGQTFRWRMQEDGSWSGPLGGQFISLRESGSGILADAYPGGPGVRDMVETHLRAGDDLRRIQAAIGMDPVMSRGMESVCGLRVVKIEEWECLCSFVLATYANIPRISKMIEALASKYGKRIKREIHAFPDLRRMRRVTLSELSRCGLGYRAKYIHELSHELEDDRISELREMGYESLRNELKSLPGVGDKVADCVSLFGFGRLESFPIDVWMARALERLYRQKGTYQKLRAFASDKWGPYAGYAQEYLYYNERARAHGGVCAFSKS